MGSVPEIPGYMLPEGLQLHHLRERVSELCGLRSTRCAFKLTRFPGAQPVSFSHQSIKMLEERDFAVCEKSDGIRVLALLITPQTTGFQEVYLIDRKNNYYRVDHIFFPHHEKKPARGSLCPLFAPRSNTILDGELVVDKIDKDQKKLRLLLFDCLVCDGFKMTDRKLFARFGRLESHIMTPYFEYLNCYNEMEMLAPFEVQLKEMKHAYHLKSVLKEVIPKLKHGNDGLIFTAMDTGYHMGTDNNILKWKPPSENTIDFKLVLRFPPDFSKDCNGSIPDIWAKPIFELHWHLHGDVHEYYDIMEMMDEQWERLKKSDEQLDDRIVECAWQDIGNGIKSWVIKRIRDDKLCANHKSTVKSIVRSIQDGVDASELLAASDLIREKWNSDEREKQRFKPNKKKLVPRPFGPQGHGPPKKTGGMPGIIRH